LKDQLGSPRFDGERTVYRVRDRELDEIVALKLLRKELGASKSTLDRFRREVKLARRVTHRNVARTFDIGEHGGNRFRTDATYGLRSEPKRAGPEITPRTIVATLAGLKPGTTVYYRLVAEGVTTTVYGEPATFTH